ncbi:hypothetical protein EYF80_045969 [Liparis tanakae]|uniref:Uncharacterized protein n=1 Tax=Liparis tanakae TaxID=230148 RepID=A0A4Z2FRQ9_9TELE|nr:hypothetical protein EYF80_045969 [Liparis tanakae]
MVMMMMMRMMMMRMMVVMMMMMRIRMMRRRMRRMRRMMMLPAAGQLPPAAPVDVHVPPELLLQLRGLQPRDGGSSSSSFPARGASAPGPAVPLSPALQPVLRVLFASFSRGLPGELLGPGARPGGGGGGGKRSSESGCNAAYPPGKLRGSPGNTGA